ncbi:hypothetical protein EMMF5_004887 [Cystobasidiomycetes sp. EMM_F5]
MQGQRFELDLDDLKNDYPIAAPSASSLIRNVKERPATSVASVVKPIQATGFPTAKRRPAPQQHDASSNGKVSRFKAARQAASEASPLAAESLPATSSLQAEIDAENEKVLANMNEDDILHDKEELIAMLGQDMADFLIKRNGPAVADDIIIEKPAETAVKVPHRNVRFNEEIQYSNPPSRSPSPKPYRAPILLPSSDDPTIGNWIEDVSQGKLVGTVSAIEPDSAAAIRDRYFPTEPLTTKLDWMNEGTEARSADSKGDVIMFNLSGRVMQKAETHDHSNSAERHAGPGTAFTVADLVQLSRSAVASQRSAAFSTFLKAITTNLLSGSDEQARALLKSSDTVNAMVGACATGLTDKNVGVVVLSIGVICAYTEYPGVLANVAAAVLTVAPPPLLTLARLLDPMTAQAELPSESISAILSTLHALVTMKEDFVASEMVDTPRLLENVSKRFIEVAWPPRSTVPTNSPTSLPHPRAQEILNSIASRNRTNAECIVLRKLDQPGLRFIAVQPWHIVDKSTQEAAFAAATCTLRLLATLARYGLGCSNLGNSDELFIRVEKWIQENVTANIDFSMAWFQLLVQWTECAADPHSTTPEHDILWAQTQDWGLHCCECLPQTLAQRHLALSASIVTALCAWMIGANRYNQIKRTEAEDALRQAQNQLVDALKHAIDDPTAPDNVGFMLAMKKLAASTGNVLEEANTLLERVQIEDVSPPQSTSADGEGWI